MTTGTAVGSEAPLAADLHLPTGYGRAERVLDVLIRSVVPVVLALVAGGILLLALGKNPLSFYGDVWTGGVENGGWQNSGIRMAP